MSGDYDDFAIDIEAVAALLPDLHGGEPADPTVYHVDHVRTEVAGFRQRLNGSTIPGAGAAIERLDDADAHLSEPYKTGALRWARNHLERAAQALRHPPEPQLNKRGF